MPIGFYGLSPPFVLSNIYLKLINYKHRRRLGAIRAEERVSNFLFLFCCRIKAKLVCCKCPHFGSRHLLKEKDGVDGEVVRKA